MEVSFRPGTPADVRAAFEIFHTTIADLGQRIGMPTFSGTADAAQLDRIWQARRSLFEHLAATSELWWFAESDRLLGFARSILRDGVRQLTDYFVIPGHQSAGVGRGILERAFPKDGARNRIILATPDTRALMRYLKTGVRAFFPVHRFARPSRPMDVPTELAVETVDASPAAVIAMAGIDREILGYRRDADHRWLLTQRRGFLYRRRGCVVGYGYVGTHCGPFAATDAELMPLILAHAEGIAARNGGDFGVVVSLTNRTALDYLLAQRFEFDPFVNYYMGDQPPRGFDRYLITDPSFFL